MGFENNMIKWVLFVFLVVLGWSSCTKEKEFDIVNLNGNQITILGHGGMGSGDQYPSNSIESILKCVSIGADGSEFDVQMTKDSVLVLFHDKLLEHSTNGYGEVHEKNWDEIKDLNYNSLLESYGLVSVEEVLIALKSPNNYRFSFDCKTYSNDSSEEYVERYCNAIAKIIDNYELENNVFVEFQDERFMIKLKQINSDYKIFVYKDLVQAVSLIKKYGFTGVTIGLDEVSVDDINYLHNEGIMVAVFRVKSKGEVFESIEKNCDIIQTSNIPLAVKTLK